MAKYVYLFSEGNASMRDLLGGVSCSPFRVPIARLAAAQARVNEIKGTKDLGQK